MSLQNLANQMQSTGRGGDTMLVHMNPKEVAGLQQLAMAHGGSLTTNPETGLPEAGFLSSILPMVISAAATAAGVPISPAQMGMASAAVSLAQGKGLMGAVSNGMQAYSGANLAQGVMSAAPVPGYQVGPEGSAFIGNQSFMPPPAPAAPVQPPAPVDRFPGAFQGDVNTLPQTQGAVLTEIQKMQPMPIQETAKLTGDQLQVLQGKDPASVRNAVDMAAETERLKSVAKSEIVSGVNHEPLSLERRLEAAGNQTRSGDLQRKLASYDRPAGVRDVDIGPNAQEVVSARKPDYGYKSGDDYMDVAHSTGPSGVSPTDVADRSISSPSGKFSSGLKAVFNDEAARDKFLTAHKGDLWMAGLSALMTPQEEKKRKAAAAVPLDAYRYDPTYSPSARYAGSTSERTYFAADGGMVPAPQTLRNSSIQGTVEQMSQMNAMGDNTRYPMSTQNTPTYAAPAERPISQNVIYPATDEPVDPYTGMPTAQMAGGGIVALKKGGKPKAPAAPKSEAQINEENATKEYAAYAKEQAANKAKEKAESDKRVAELRKEYTDRINGFNRDTQAELTQKQKDIANEKDKEAKARMQQELRDWQSGRSSELKSIQNDQNSAIKDRTNEYTNRVKELDAEIRERKALRDFDTSVYKSGYTGFSSDIKGDDFTGINKGYDTEIGKQKSEAGKAKAALDAAKKTGIQSLIDRAQDTYNQQQGEFEEANKAKESRLNQFREETKRTTSGIASRGEYTTKTGDVDAIKQQIADIKNNPKGSSGMGATYLTPEQQKQIKDLEAKLTGMSAAGKTYNPATGQYETKEEKKFQELKKAPGYGATKKIMEEEDVRQLFEEVAGRAPTQGEMAKYLGKNISQADLVNALTGKTGLAELSAARTFSDEDLNAQAKYYWGRDMTRGELAFFKDPSNKLTNFNSLRGAMQNNPAYLQNLNKINQASFNKTMDADRVAAEGPVTREQVSSVYKDLFGKPPTAEQLQAALSSGASISQLTSQLKTSPEYTTKMTQPLVPEIKQGATPAIPAINTIATPPVTPISQAQIDAYRQGYNAPATGGQSTTQLNLGPLFGSTGQGGYVFNQPQQQASIEGALPYQDVINRLGIGGVYQQIANKAPELQAGVQFNVPQGYTPIGQTTLTPDAQAALNAQMKAKAAAEQQTVPMAAGGMAGGGYNLGGYSDGGRLLRGPGDGVSDSIPASIGNRQPARLADGEFVIPARIVSELGNGSTEAGARKLYDMMARVQRARKKTMGKGRVAVNSRADKMLPA